MNTQRNTLPQTTRARRLTPGHQTQIKSLKSIYLGRGRPFEESQKKQNPATQKESEEELQKQLEEIRRHKKLLQKAEKSPVMSGIIKQKILKLMIEYKKNQIKAELTKNGRSPGYYYLQKVLEQMQKEQKS